VKVERYGFFIPRNPRSLGQRFLYESTFFLSICRSLLRDARFDAVLVFCPLAGSVAFAGLHKLFHHRPVFLNVQDLPADAAAAGGLVAGGWFKALLRGVQSILFNRADVWSSISPVMVERLEDIRRHDQPIIVVPNWPHRSLVAQIRAWPSKEGRPPGKPVRLLYAGNIGTKQGLLEFCEILQRCPAPFDFRIHGEGAVATEVRDWVHSCGDRRFCFGPLLGEPGFVQALHETDLFVITERSGSGASFFPSKAAAGMASGTPLLTISDPDSPLGREVRSFDLGPWLSWNSGAAVGELLASLPGQADALAAWQANVLRRSRYYDRERCLDLVETVLDEMVLDRRLTGSPAADGPESWATFGLTRAGAAAATPTLSSRALRRVRSLLWRTPA
jgi:hypothetical protein